MSNPIYVYKFPNNEMVIAELSEKGNLINPYLIFFIPDENSKIIGQVNFKIVLQPYLSLVEGLCSELEFNLNNIIFKAIPSEQLKNQYIQAKTGIILPN